MAQELDRILERIRKLLAVAGDDRANEGERDNALRMANNLMAKHQLDAAMIPDAQRDRDDPVGRFDNAGFGTVWTHMIRNSIGRLFDCRYFQGGKNNATQHRFIYVGRASNATTAMLMSEWVVRTAIREADRIGGHRLSAAGRSAGLGFAFRLDRRITDLLASQAKDVATEHGLDVADTSRALVVVHANALAEADAWVSANMRVSKSRALRSSKIDGDAWAQGADAANKVNLSKQVTATPKPKGIK